jgi:fatty acid desaturase
MIPVVKGAIREHEDVTGYLVSIDSNAQTSTHKSVTTTRYYAVFHFEEYGDRHVAIEKRTFENGKKGDTYTFLRKHVNNDGYTFFLMIGSFLAFVLTVFSTFLVIFCVYIVLTEKQPIKNQNTI